MNTDSQYKGTVYIISMRHAAVIIARICSRSRTLNQQGWLFNDWVEWVITALSCWTKCPHFPGTQCPLQRRAGPGWEGRGTVPCIAQLSLACVPTHILLPAACFVVSQNGVPVYLLVLPRILFPVWSVCWVERLMKSADVLALQLVDPSTMARVGIHWSFSATLDKTLGNAVSFILDYLAGFAKMLTSGI